MLLKAIIFDWAGTVVDFGCLCPMTAFRTAFHEKGIVLTAEDIRQFMGLHKRDHVMGMLSLPGVMTSWQAVHGRQSDARDVDLLHQAAEQLMLETIAESATPIPGLTEVLELAHRQALKIGSTTGYTSPLMERLAPAAAQQGYMPEFWVASDQVPQGRPWPWMIFKNMEHLRICPPAAVVKVGDTVSDVAEANNAGVWSVAIVDSSSLVGKSKADLAAMPEKDRQLILQQTAGKLAEAGAHFVINSLAELASTIEQIEHRLAKGRLPTCPASQ